jgi:FAD/FMN-containing dehydrogenase
MGKAVGRRFEEAEMFSSSAPDLIDALKTQVSGVVVCPVDPGYDEARGVWNGMIDRHPLAVVHCENDDDVAAVIRIARQFERPLAVHGGGHNVAGLATTEGGIVADLSAMREVRVDPERRRATVQGGATLGDVDAATQQYGLAAPLGVVSETGVAGLTLGGGVGWLRRKHGLSCDNVVAADVITADGKKVRASSTENPDLLWALRGGGGNFGVVTSFEFRLYPVGPEVDYALVFYRGEETREILRRFRELAHALPHEIAPIAFTGTMVEGEGIPPAVVGEPMLAVAAVHAASSGGGAELLRPLRTLAEPLVDLSGRMPFVEMQQFLDEEYPRGRRYYWKSAALDELSDEVLDVIVGFAGRQPSPLNTIDLWVMGGALRREPEGGSAYAGRSAGYLVNPEANWDDPADDTANIGWARDLIGALKPYTVGNYLNFPGMLEEGERQLRASFGLHYERLTQIKRRWDPDNFFRLNHNVPPAEAEAA